METHQHHTAPQHNRAFSSNSIAHSLFEAVAVHDYDTLANLYAHHAQHTILQFLQMKRRWISSAQENNGFIADDRSEEKMDEYLQQLTHTDEHPVKKYVTDESYVSLLRELANFLVEQHEKKDDNQKVAAAAASQPYTNSDLLSETERLLRNSASMLSDSRPPANFVVYENGVVQDSDEEENETMNNSTPIFDGSVANATPPPLMGGALANGGAGTILHLACALDVPLCLAFLLSMGADARASHTAFRRLMIHEAACNGSLKCLQLLLELGQYYEAKAMEEEIEYSNFASSPDSSMDFPFFPPRRSSTNTYSATAATSPLDQMVYNTTANYETNSDSSGLHNKPCQRKSRKQSEDGHDCLNFVGTLRLFRDVSRKVRQGTISEIDAARELLFHTKLSESTKHSLAKSCAYGRDDYESNSGRLVPPVSPSATPPRHSSLFWNRSNGGRSDGHGNTPLHWAAFKNETACVKLLLEYKADSNAKAHPSGWTPLHDAAYSNGRESIQLLLDAGAFVDSRANSGATPLCFAAQEDAAEAAELLLDRGADLTIRCAGNQTNNNNGPPTNSRFSGYTPLHYCAHYNAKKAARVLLKHPTAAKAMEIADLNDRLPIHVAVARGSSDVLRELLRAGARVETRPSPSVGSSPANRRRRLNRSSSPRRRRPPSPEGVTEPTTPRNHNSDNTADLSALEHTPVSSPVLRSMIPSQPVTSSKPWNCLSQRSIDECRKLINEVEQNWTPDRHTLFTPHDRKAVAALLLVGKRLEQHKGIFIDFWPEVLSFCGRGWFEQEICDETESESSTDNVDDILDARNTDDLRLPTFC